MAGSAGVVSSLVKSQITGQVHACAIHQLCRSEMYIDILLEGHSDTKKNKWKIFNSVSGIGTGFEGCHELAV